MKTAGFLLLAAGWFLVLSTLALLGANPARGAFIAAGLGVEILGLALAVRSHLTPARGRSERSSGY